MGQTNENLLNRYVSEENIYDDIPESIVDENVENRTVIEDGIENDSEENLETSKEIDREVAKENGKVEEKAVEQKTMEQKEEENTEDIESKLAISEEEYNSNFEVELANRINMGISKELAEAELKEEMSKKYFIIDRKVKIREDEKEHILNLLKRKIRESGEIQNIDEKAEEEFSKKYKVIDNLPKENLKIDLYEINRNTTLNRREISVPEYIVLFNLMLRRNIIKNKNIEKSELIKEIEMSLMAKYKIEKIEISQVNYDNILKTKISEKINSGIEEKVAEIEAKNEINSVYYLKKNKVTKTIKEEVILEDPVTLFEDIERNKAKEINLNIDFEDLKKELIEELTKVIKNNQPKPLSKEVEEIKKEFSEIFEILNEWKN